MYEQVLYELLEAGERDLAKEILKTAEPLLLVKAEQPERYLRLETFCKRPFFNASDVYDLGQTKDSRRQELAQALASEVSAVPPARLLALLSDALRWQQANQLLPEGSYDLFRGGKKVSRKEGEDSAVKRLQEELSQSARSSGLRAVAFSPNGEACMLAAVDGYFEFHNSDDLSLRRDLAYQAEERFLSTGRPVLCATFSKDSDHIAVGTEDGQVIIFRISSGQAMRTFSQAHLAAVSSLQFARDGSQILSASFDTTARIHGLKSGKVLREFRGHTSYVHSACYTRESAANVVTGSADGTVKLWDGRSADCLFTYRPGSSPGTGYIQERAVLAVIPIPRMTELYVVVSRSHTVHVMTAAGAEAITMSSGKTRGADFVAAAVSPQGRWLYCAAEDNVIYIFDLKAGQLEDVITLQIESGLPAQEQEVVELAHHPQRNLLAAVQRNGSVKFFSS